MGLLAAAAAAAGVSNDEYSERKKEEAQSLRLLITFSLCPAFDPLLRVRISTTAGHQARRRRCRYFKDESDKETRNIRSQGADIRHEATAWKCEYATQLLGSIFLRLRPTR